MINKKVPSSLVSSAQIISLLIVAPSGEPAAFYLMQSFNFRSVVLPEISLDEKSVTISRPITHTPN